MKRSARCGKILDLLRVREELTVEEVCTSFAISPATARRDFATLVTEGRAGKTWGGLRSLDPQISPMVPSTDRRQIHGAEKHLVASRAASLCEDGDIIFVDGGTTTLELAHWFANRPLRIVTNSLLMACEIDRLRTGACGAEVFMTGGYLLPQSAMLVGPEAAASLEKYHAQVAFLSVGAISEEGFTNNHPLVVELERVMIRNAKKLVLLADDAKFGHRELIPECSWDEFDYLITNRTPAPEFCALAGDRLLIADSSVQ